MGASRPRMQDVVLVETDGELDARPLADGGGDAEAADLSGAPRPPATAAIADWLRRTRRWWAVGTGIALVVAANAAASAWRENARVAALAGMPGVVAPLDGSVTELWRTEANLLWSPPVAGRLLGVREDPDGSAEVVALDPRTGKAGWRTPVRDQYAITGWTNCVLPDPPTSTGGKAATPAVVCVIADAVVVTDEDTSGYVYSPSRTRLVVLDARDGRILSDDPALPSLSIAALGPDLVTSTVASDGRVHVRRTDARGGPVQWAFTSPDPIPLDDAQQRVASVEIAGDRIVVRAGPTWVLSGAGTVLGHWTADVQSRLGNNWVNVMQDGRLVIEPVAVSDAGEATNQVHDLESGRSFRAIGNPAYLAVDDGSLADLFLTTSLEQRGLTAYDIESGDRKWKSRINAEGTVLVMDGRVVRADVDELQSIDGRTGKTVWTTPITPSAPGSMLSDGRVVLITQPTADTRGDLITAYGLDDGRLRWQTHVSEDFYLFEIDGRLFGWSQQGKVVALG